MPHRDSPLPQRTPRILHLDVDAFLASVESARRPELRGKPLVIGAPPTSRGLVMSCSYEARAFGVRAGMFSHEAARRCPQAIFLPGDSQAANRIRQRLAALLLGFTPVVEISSIDDFFLDLAGTTRLMGAACEVGHAIRKAAEDELHLPVTIGIATSKTIARLAGKLGKPGGIAEILPGQEEAFLTHLPVHHLPGVGHALRRAFDEFGIQTVGELRQISKELLFSSFGAHGLTLFCRARGLDDEPVHPNCTLSQTEAGQVEIVQQNAPKTIHRDSSFEPEEGRTEQIEAMLAYLVDRASDRLRKHSLRARSMEVRVRYATHQNGPAQEKSTGRLRRKLPCPTYHTEDLWQHARALLHELPRRRALVKRIGVSLLTLEPRGDYQHLLFPAFGAEPEPAGDPAGSGTTEATAETTPGTSRGAVLDNVLDTLRGRHGFGSVVRGAALPLMNEHERGEDGFKLRTPSLNQ